MKIKMAAKNTTLVHSILNLFILKIIFYLRKNQDGRQEIIETTATSVSYKFTTHVILASHYH